MLTLAIETATNDAQVAVADDGHVLASFTCGRERHHAEVLTPAIRFCCQSAGVELGDVGRVAVDIGPGLYTGLRVGIATAKALAHAFDVPLVGATSLEIQAADVGDAGPGTTVVSTIDARRGEVFYELFAPDDTASTPTVGTPEQLATELEERAAEGEQFLLVGDGLARCGDSLNHIAGVSIQLDHPRQPSAATLARLAQLGETTERSRNGSTAALQPLYLRLPDAQVNFEQRSRPSTGSEPPTTRASAPAVGHAGAQAEGAVGAPAEGQS